jgi:DUF971 family protein
VTSRYELASERHTGILTTVNKLHINIRSFLRVVSPSANARCYDVPGSQQQILKASVALSLDVKPLRPSYKFYMEVQSMALVDC